MRSAISSSGAAGLLIALTIAVAACRATEPAGPSLVLVTFDTLRVDRASPYGGSREITPHLDAFARAALIHDAAFTTMPTTGPAHVSIFTGLLPSAHGSRRNGEPMRRELRERELAARLRARGYATGAFVTAHVLDPKATGLAGFDAYDAPRAPLRPGASAAEAALRWLDAVGREPVFLWLHLYDPHSPYGNADQKRRGMPIRPDHYGWVDTARYADPVARRRMRADYDLGVRQADAAFGQLLEGLRERLSAPPLVAVTADHGEAFDEHLDTRGYAWDHGEFLDREQIAVPLLLAGPGVAPGRSTGAVSLRDLYTTLLAAAGIPDEQAGAEGRVDLRRPVAGPRVVVVERRDFAPGSLRAAGERAGAVRGHAVAASDGSALGIVGEDGRVTQEPGDAAAVLDAARAGWRAGRARAEGRDLELDPQLEEALRSLGYAP